MAVDSLFHPTEALILPTPRKLYPATMVAAHWQLRSMVSCLHSDTIYYPWGRDIYQLNVSSCEREIIATVPFTPRCLVGANGWLCCGGEHGNFAMIKLPGAGDEAGTAPSMAPDARLPLDLDPSHRTQDFSFSSSSSISRSPVTRTTKVGTELVNCITLWFPGPERSEAAYPRPLCISANNDKSVTILDLKELTPLETLIFPDSINRALVSPDGRLLIAIGDDPFMYIYERKEKVDRRSLGIKDKADYAWQSCGKIQLEGQRPTDPTEMRGSFAAAFSSSGRYLAVGTQYGVISIFDAASLTDDRIDPLIVSFKSSRPGHKVGAVRSMEFARDPLDLLAWTENSGHIGVADARDNFLSRQIITVDAQAPGIEKMVVSDGVGDLPPFAGLRPNRAETTGSRFATDASGLDGERRQLRQLTRYLLDRQLTRESERHQSPFSQEELEVLEALQVDRRQRYAAQQEAEDNERATPERVDRQFGRLGDRSDPSSVLPTTLRDLLNINNRTREIMQSYIIEHSQDRDRRGGLLPRRRDSVSLAAAQLAFERELRDGRDNGRSSRTAPGGERSSSQDDSESPPRPSGASPYNASNPWAEMERLYSFAVDHPPADPTTRYRLEIESDDRPDYLRRLETIQRTLDTRRQTWNVPDPGPEDTRTVPGGIMGCCWGQDGHKLFVGAADGIYEYHVNVAGRRFFPSMTLR